MYSEETVRYTARKQRWVSLSHINHLIRRECYLMTSDERTMRYVIVSSPQGVSFIYLPASYAYQLIALHQRLHKEIGKLTATDVPSVPVVLAECAYLELTNPHSKIETGLAYVQTLEQCFVAITEETYPLISLLTEIRALLAQLEQWTQEQQEA